MENLDAAVYASDNAMLRQHALLSAAAEALQTLADAVLLAAWLDSADPDNATWATSTQMAGTVAAVEALLNLKEQEIL